ncbi:hypothetical protein [Deinococcus altitudinis]|uniref:hypothetical protein n=1 Tax=Deinococcus altitudinis TaxID=468914 RepID=UPI0038921A1C
MAEKETVEGSSDGGLGCASVVLTFLLLVGCGIYFYLDIAFHVFLDAFNDMPDSASTMNADLGRETLKAKIVLGIAFLAFLTSVGFYSIDRRPSSDEVPAEKSVLLDENNGPPSK